MISTRNVGRLIVMGLLVGAATAASAQGVLVKGHADAVPPQGMTSEFHNLVQQLREVAPGKRAELEKSGHAERYAPIFVSKDGGEKIQTHIWLKAWDAAVLKALESAGVEIDATDPDRYLVQAWVSLNDMEQVAQIPGVRQLRRPSYGIPTLGTVTSEGDVNLNTNFVRSIGNLTGAGVRVGVISAGLYNQFFPVRTVTNDDERVKSENIPADPSVPPATFGRFGGVVITPNSSAAHRVTEYGLDNETPPEGAAILETIFDIAPQPGNPAARAYFAGVRTDVDVVNARIWLASNGVHVIVDNFNFFDVGRFDGSSAISRGAQLLTMTRNISYITSVGNYNPPTENQQATAATRFPLFVNGYFSPNPAAGAGKFHNFNSGRAGGEREEILIIAPQGGVIDVVLVWDDVWDDKNPRATDDLDLYLLDPSSPDLNRSFASSIDIQNNSGRPIERLTYFANETSEPLGLAINRKGGAANANTLFTLLILQGTVPANKTKYLTHAVPLANADALPPVISVGGVDHVVNDRPTPTTVPGMSPGPGRAMAGDYVRWFTTQESPAVVSYTNTAAMSMRQTSSGINISVPFAGSSAGAAHIGGFVTLLRAAFPEIPAYDFYDILRDISVPPSGFPNATVLTPDLLAGFVNKPSYRRVNGLDTYLNLREELLAGTRTRSLAVATFDAEGHDWTASDVIEGFNAPLAEVTPQGLRLSPNGQDNVFGFWETGTLEFPTADGPAKELRSDRVYAVRARVGTDETDPAKVPVFRLRVLTGGGDEAASLYIANVTSDAGNAPSTLGGKEYTLYYRPSSPAVAAKGMRFAFDIMHTGGLTGKNANSSIYLQDLSIEEVALD